MPGSDRPARLLHLVGRVYDAALDENLWPGIATEIAATFDSTSTAVFSASPSSAKLLSTTGNFEQSAARDYEAYYHQKDIWFEAGFKQNLGKVIVSHEIMPDRAYAETEIYRDFVRGMGVFYMVGAVAPLAPGETVCIGIHRPQPSGRFENADVALVSAFLPHLQRALQIRQRLAEPGIAVGAALDALDRSGTATLVTTRDGSVLYANHVAERLLRGGLGIAAVGGRLATGHRAASDRLRALIRGATDTAAGASASSGGALAIERGDRLPLTVLVAPFRPARDGFGAPLPAAVVFIRDPEQPTAATLTLQGLFGVTPAEACVAAMLAQGRSTDDIAAGLRVTPNTVRAHLKNIYVKTGTSRQAQLVALILSSVAALV